VIARDETRDDSARFTCIALRVVFDELELLSVQAARVVDLAREKSDGLIQRDAVVQAAQNRAANIIEQARQDAEAIRSDADNYVLDVLNGLEAHLLKTLTVVRNGINKIQVDREAARERADALASVQDAELDPEPAKTTPMGAPMMSTPISTPVEIPADTGRD